MDETRTHSEPPQAEPLPSRKEQVPATTLSRKRQIDSNSNDNEPRLKRAQLTRKNLATFDKTGKKTTPTHRASTDGSLTIKTISTTTSGFAIKAFKNGILDPRHSKPPTNLEDVRKRYARSRKTASPPESIYEHYVNRVAGAKNEATMVVEVSGKLLKEYDDKGYPRVFNQVFTGLPKDIGFNNGLFAPQPDFIEGLEMPEYRPFPVDDFVPGAALYQDDPSSLALPHIAGEWKGRGKDMENVRLQSAYDGAALVHARNQALAYMGKFDPPGHAEITTFTTDGTNLNLYAHYATPLEEDQNMLEYHQFQYASINAKDSYQGYKDGRKGLRNTQDHAKKQSYALRDQLKEHWKQCRNTLNTPTEEAPHAPDVKPTHNYEETTQRGDEANYEIIEQPCQPTPATSSKPPKASRSHSSSKSSHHSSSDYHKRKASSSQTSSHGSPGHASKHRSYWKKDPKTGSYYHRHSDGKVSWLDDEEDEDGY